MGVLTSSTLVPSPCRQLVVPSFFDIQNEYPQEGWKVACSTSRNLRIWTGSMAITYFLYSGFHGRLCRNGKPPPIPFSGVQQQRDTVVHTISYGNLHHRHSSFGP